jgi:hypothetical protein
MLRPAKDHGLDISWQSRSGAEAQGLQHSGQELRMSLSRD